MENFTPIGITAAEMSPHKKRVTANDIYDKTHIGFGFAFIV